METSTSDVRVVSTVPVSFAVGPLRRGQQLHALAIVFLPVIGAAFALRGAAASGIELWQIVLCVVMYLATMIGVSVGFHRHLTHRAFDASRPVHVLLTILGSAAAQGPPLYWIINHRRHHRFSDAEGDPHSPNRHEAGLLGELGGLWHAHVGWMFTHELTNPLVFGRDLLRDPVFMRINRMYPIWVLAGVVVPMLVGAAITGTVAGAISGALWGAGVRLFFSYHFTSCINSVTHALGARPFATSDYSRNVSWLALPTVGESWHNNHHAFPRSAWFGLRWWQLDLGGYVIAALQATHLIWNVHTARPRQDESPTSGTN